MVLLFYNHTYKIQEAKEDKFMVTHSTNYYINKMSSRARKVILDFLNTKPDHSQLSKDADEYYRLRAISDKAVAIK